MSMGPILALAAAKKSSILCEDQHLLPVRYALSSEETPPIFGTNLYCGKLPTLSSHKFTLRTIYSGYIFVTWDGLPDLAVYKAHSRKFTLLTEHGLSGGPTIRIPKDKKQFFIRYVRIPDVEQQNGNEVLWKMVAENLKKDKDTLMQQVTLEEELYDAPLDKFRTYIEEYRKEPGYLAFLPCWKENSSILKMPADTLPSSKTLAPVQRWRASCEPYIARDNPTNSFCQSTRLVALHDCVGNLLDCAAVHARSNTGIAYFQRWHSPLLVTGVLIDKIIAGRKIREREKWRQETARRHAELAQQVARVKKQWATANCHRLPAKDLPDIIAEDLKRNPCPVPRGNSSDENTAFLKKISQSIDINFKQRDEHAKNYKEHFQTLCDSADVLIKDWTTLLKHDDKHYSLNPTLMQVFKSGDQENPSSEKLADPLTTSRGAVFAMCHMGIADLPVYLSALDGLFGDAVYTDLWKHVIGNGGVPQSDFSAWLLNLLPFVGYRVKHNGLRTDPLLTMLLDTGAKRLSVISPAAQPSSSTDVGYALAEVFALTSNEDMPLDSAFRSLAESLASPAMMEKLSGDLLPIFSNEKYRIWAEAAGMKAAEISTLEKQAARAAHDLERYERFLARLQSVQPAWQNKKGGGLVVTPKGKGWERRERRLGGLKEGMGKRSARYGAAERQMSALTRKVSRTSAAGTALSAVCLVAGTMNMAELTKKCLEAQSSGLTTDVIFNTVRILPSALTFIKGARDVFFRQALLRLTEELYRKIYTPMIVVTGALDLFDLYNVADYDAMLTSLVVSTAGTAILWSDVIAATLVRTLPWVTTLSVAGVLMLAFAVGSVIYIWCLDEADEKFLKNNLWSNLGKYPGCRDALVNEPVDMEKMHLTEDGMLMPTPQEWLEANNTLNEYLKADASPQVTIGLDARAMYILIQAWNPTLQSGALHITLEVQALPMFGMQSDSSTTLPVSIDERFLLGDTAVNGTAEYVLFEAYFDMRRIRKHIEAMPYMQYVPEMCCKVRANIGGNILDTQTFTVSPDNPWVNPTKEARNKLQHIPTPAPEGGETC